MWKNTAIIVAVASTLVVGLLLSTGLILTFDRQVSLHSPRFSRDGQHIFYVERQASGVTFGPGLEFFTPPAKLRVFSDNFILKEIDLEGREVTSLISWKMPRQQFFIPSYRKHLFGYVKITWEIKGDVVALYCKLNEMSYPR